jgi:hypothetical protein
MSLTPSRSPQGQTSQRPRRCRRLHHNVLAIALGNKLSRIAWSVLVRGRLFEATKVQVA